MKGDFPCGGEKERYPDETGVRMRWMKQYRVRKIKIAAGGRDLSLLVLQPLQPAFRKTPGIVWLHGGGYALGMPEIIYLSRALPLVERYGAVVVSPRYRLAARHPYPAALEDCYAALQYLKAHAEELGCASNQIMVGGESAGGGLAAALCMLARDRGEVRIAFQMLCSTIGIRIHPATTMAFHGARGAITRLGGCTSGRCGAQSQPMLCPRGRRTTVTCPRLIRL